MENSHGESKESHHAAEVKHLITQKGQHNNHEGEMPNETIEKGTQKEKPINLRGEAGLALARVDRSIPLSGEAEDHST